MQTSQIYAKILSAEHVGIFEVISFFFKDLIVVIEGKDIPVDITDVEYFCDEQGIKFCFKPNKDMSNVDDYLCLSTQMMLHLIYEVVELNGDELKIRFNGKTSTVDFEDVLHFCNHRGEIIPMDLPTNKIIINNEQ